MKPNETMLNTVENNKELLDALDYEHHWNGLSTPMKENAHELSSVEKIEKIKEHFEAIMETLGMDLTDESLQDTPKRVAKMFVNEVFKGLNPENKPSKIVIPTTDGFSIIQITEIIRCEGEKNYTQFYLKDGSKPIVSKTLKEYEDLLQGHNFLRIFKSHLINLAHVRRYIKGRGGEVVMSDGKRLPVSRERKNELLEKLHSI